MFNSLRLKSGASRFAIGGERVARAPQREDTLSSEMILRYACATAATILALAGAQLIVRTDFILALVAVTLLGAPVSMALRLSRMRIGGQTLSRPFWNFLITLLTLGILGFFLVYSLRDFLASWDGSPERFWLRFGAGDSMGLLIQVFLIFAAFRSFSLISDKDCTLTTVPSFSVLLLLIPVHKGIEVVGYFILWTLVAALLFALDHRTEQRAGVVGVVRAPIAGDDSRMAARSLGTILALSLVGAVATSIFLSSRDPDDRSETETAITALAGRLTQMALSMPESGVNSGPERQIDFSSGPSLPTRNVLWQFGAVSLEGEILQSEYLRLFTLSNYNGAGWSQAANNQNSARRRQLQRAEWPLPQIRRERETLNTGGAPRFSTGRLDRRRELPTGYSVAQQQPQTARQFGRNSVAVRQLIVARNPNLGFIPLLPAPQSVRLPDSEQNEIRTRSDGSVDVGVVQIGQTVRAYSLVPRVAEYGFRGAEKPSKNVAPRAGSPQLSPSQRAQNLALPKNLPARVRKLAATYLQNAKPDDSNLARAQRLALGIQDGAVYTLRPPSIPQGRDATDFFLFEGNRRGYCTYFAGALTVLCRTQGIPARVVSGFANPEYDAEFFGTVREANAHAWTEIWVENWGWAVVDATPPADIGDNAPSWTENWADLFGASLDSSLRWTRDHSTLLGALALGAVIFFAALRYRHKIARLWPASRVGEAQNSWSRREIAAIYAQAAKQIAAQFRPRAAWETPDEWREAAAQALPQLPREPLETLTALYVRASFSPAEVSSEQIKLAQKAAAQLGRKQKSD